MYHHARSMMNHPGAVVLNDPALTANAIPMATHIPTTRCGIHIILIAAPTASHVLSYLMRPTTCHFAITHVTLCHTRCATQHQNCYPSKN